MHSGASYAAPEAQRRCTAHTSNPIDDRVESTLQWDESERTAQAMQRRGGAPRMET